MNRRIFRDVVIPSAFYAFLFFFCQTVAAVFIEIAYVAAQSGQSLKDALLQASDVLLSHASLITVAGDGLCLLIILIISGIKKVSPLRFTGINGKIGIKTVFRMLLAGIFLNIWISFMLSALPIPESALSFYDEASSLADGNTALGFIAAVFFAPLTEEVIFRGLIYKHFRICMPEYAAVIFQAIIFAAFHGPSVVWMAYAFAMGLLLGYVAMLTRGISASILLHAGFNLCSYLLELVPEESGALSAIVLLSPFVIIWSVAALVKETGKNQ